MVNQSTLTALFCTAVLAAVTSAEEGGTRGLTAVQRKTVSHSVVAPAPIPAPTPTASCPAVPRTLQIIHSSDNESSFIDPNTLETKISGYAAVTNALETLAALEGVPSIHVTAGDHTIPGPFYLASAEIPAFGQPGLADIAIFNAMGLDANGIGNHELDGGISEFAYMLFAADYPFISVNLDFSGAMVASGAPSIRIGADGVECSAVAGHVVKSCYIETGIGRVGLIGRSPADFFNVIEDPVTTLPGVDFVGGRDCDTNQAFQSALPLVLEQVDILEAAGANIIVLLDHAQDFTADPLSASSLRGVDVIVSAGSTGFFGQSLNFGPYNFLREGDAPDTQYPVIQTDSNGDSLLVVNTDQLYRYVGHLLVTFDDAGKLKTWDGRSGPIASTDAAIALFGDLACPNDDVNAILAQLQATPSIQESFEVIGTTGFPLNGERADVRTRETNLARVVADSTLVGANKYAAANGLPLIDIGFKNAGGIRDSITGPNIISLTIQAALAFDNKLTLLQVTGGQLLAVMENSVSRAPAADGRFPAVAGLTMEYDASKPGVEAATTLTTPSRVKTLIIIDASENCIEELVVDFTVVGDLSATFTIGTNSFLATGGDGYASFAEAAILGTTDIGEQDILKEYIVCELGGVVNVADPTDDPRVVPV